MIIKGRKGFTLIEILIVVAIIAILASVVLVGLGPTQAAGRDARRLSDLHEVQNGLELYFSSCGGYPGTANCGGTLGTSVDGTAPYDTTHYGGVAQALVTTTNLQISSMPKDPIDKSGHVYEYGGNATYYLLAATLENASNSVFINYQAPTVQGTITGDLTGTTGCGKTGLYCLSL